MHVSLAVLIVFSSFGFSASLSSNASQANENINIKEFNLPIIKAIQDPNSKKIYLLATDFPSYDYRAPVDGCTVYRIFPDGSLDLSFGNQGSVTGDINHRTQENCYDMALRGNDLVVAGDTNPTQTRRTRMFAKRFNASTGAEDLTFGARGARVLATQFSNAAGSEEVRAVIIEANRKVTLFGSRETSAGTVRAAIARLNANGTLDITFSGDGLRVYTATPKIAKATLGPDNNYYILTSYFMNGVNDNFYSVLKVSQSGAPVWQKNSPNGAGLGGVGIQTVADKIYTVLDAPAYQYPISISRYNVNGLEANLATYNNSSNIAITALEKGFQNKFLLSMTNWWNANSFVFAKINLDGTLDTLFGDQGFFTYTSENYAYSAAYDTIQISETQYLMVGVVQKPASRSMGAVIFVDMK